MDRQRPSAWPPHPADAPGGDQGCPTDNRTSSQQVAETLRGQVEQPSPKMLTGQRALTLADPRSARDIGLSRAAIGWDVGSTLGLELNPGTPGVRRRSSKRRRRSLQVGCELAMAARGRASRCDTRLRCGDRMRHDDCPEPCRSRWRLRPVPYPWERVQLSCREEEPSHNHVWEGQRHLPPVTTAVIRRLRLEPDQAVTHTVPTGRGRPVGTARPSRVGLPRTTPELTRVS